ncbi:MAG: hypothetical protein H8E79_03865 [Desulfobulbaceae bacterium]|uniref:Uncharacterized protein n=1 Tax=Candidatus Desulfatifera sulfidica TaxID=2841691 RepID=A0A8J6N941_9BACT|nr:hypothetical protein [Candidatus Desulfatifera sulfidica]
MNDRLQELIATIKKLEQELIVELQKKEAEYSYEIRNKKVYFEQAIRRRHRYLLETARHYLRHAALVNILTAPFIWACLFPALLMDLMASVYQFVCFPAYNIPKVRRSDYIVIDRHYLSYLNWIEKINCCYCGYFNGLISYIHEIAARTELYWCPIKHARRTRASHNHYHNFFDYGDAERYRRELNKIRAKIRDLS